MEGPHITLKVGNHESLSTSDEAIYKELLEQVASEPDLLAILKELDRSEFKKKIISAALLSVGGSWRSLSGMNADAKQSFGHLLAHWDTPLNGKPKTQEDHYEDARGFAKLL